MKKLIIAAISIMVFTSISFAHSGGTDRYGGHNDNRTGTYHYHSPK